MSATGEVLAGLWRFEAAHPEWTEEEGGEEGWERIVAWWALRTSSGLILIDPLVLDDWDALDRFVGEHGGCAAIVRTIHFHQRSIAEAATRYGAEVWSGIAPDRVELQPSDRVFGQTEHTWTELGAFATERFDEVALWLPEQSALLFGDAMLRRDDGTLRVCPESWTQPAGGHERLRELLRGLTGLPIEHVLVSHGPLVLGDGQASLTAALG